MKTHVFCGASSVFGVRYICPVKRELGLVCRHFGRDISAMDKTRGENDCLALQIVFHPAPIPLAT
jgi:hypothetical protein